MSSHKGPAVAQGSGAPASDRDTDTDTVELAELGPLLKEKGKRAIATPTKVSGAPGPASPQSPVRLCLARSPPASRRDPPHPGAPVSVLALLHQEPFPWSVSPTVQPHRLTRL